MKAKIEATEPWQEYEIAFQARLTKWAWNAYPETRFHIFAVPNGMMGNVVMATQAMASGAVKGVHDLIFYWTGHPMQTFELKVKNREATPEQIRFGREVIRHGGRAYLIDEANGGEELFMEIVLETIGRRLPSLESYFRQQTAQKVFKWLESPENSSELLTAEPNGKTQP
jgi:hypothetical protein